MEIKDIIKCENDNILPIQSKMIANLLLSGLLIKYISTKMYQMISIISIILIFAITCVLIKI